MYVIISLDQEKAFDRVNRGFLQRVLERFNFGPHFRKWVGIVYADITSSVINNGWLSSSFSLERGVRQGCPLSPLLYCLVVETLGQAIRKDLSIEGIQILGSRGKQNKVSQYEGWRMVFARLCMRDGETSVFHCEPEIFVYFEMRVRDFEVILEMRVRDFCS